MDITIIADNGGGLTLQLVDDYDRRYQHYYKSPTQCATDIKTALADDSFEGWDGNEADDEDGNDCWLDPTCDQIRNGGYRILSADQLDVESSWRNIRELARALA